MQYLSDKITRTKRTKFYSSTRERIKKTGLYQSLDIAAFYIASSFSKNKYESYFGAVETFCLFLGHGRSGHSIVGALLDAHPNVILSDEADALKYLAAGFTPDQIFYVLLHQSRKHARHKRRKLGRGNKMYSYWVSDQWQGRFKRLQVIGDSKAGVSAQRLSQDPELIQKLRRTIHGNLKFIQIVRNPYDNISTMSLRGKKELPQAIDDYFKNCEAVSEIYQHIDMGDVLISRHEDLIDNPQKFLKEMNQFIGVEPFDDYLNACASVIYKSPAKSRGKISWDKAAIEDVRTRMKAYDFLAGYSYEK